MRRKMLVSVVCCSFFMSGLALALQLKKAQGLEGYRRAYPLSELEYRFVLLNVELTRNSTALRDGVGVPFVQEIFPDANTVDFFVPVFSDELPTDHKQRRLKFLGTAESVKQALRTSFPDIAENRLQVRIEFGDLLSPVKGKGFLTIAEYKNGELSFR